MSENENLIFDDYAQYYNLLYRDKNYREEALYVKSLIEREQPGASTVLDLGCGTGMHDRILVEEGLQVTGVDLSEQMISIAKKNESENLNFVQGDAREINLNNQFDVVVALFHVMSYQATNDDLMAVFNTAKAHLNKGGIFIFDCWYGPAVLTDRPVVRVKRLENEAIKLVRISEPEMHSESNNVDVIFNLFIKDKATGHQKEIQEKHSMRYLFYPEMEFFALNAGFTITEFEEWLTGKKPDYYSWNVVFCCKKI
ncbi:MAG: class I SAM-dependent methyltransferase [Candidatus Azobacteroides sp.]|nr:class I SAM-dependent methyltransferase [Candidatus Azobacteroides sp.]